MCFGTDNDNVSSAIGFRQYGGDYSLQQTAMNIGGYLPIIGVGFFTGVITAPAAPYIAAVGVASALFRAISSDLQAGTEDDDGQRLDEAQVATLKNNFLRGMAELFCLGPVLLVADVIKTLWEIFSSDACGNCCENLSESAGEFYDNLKERLSACFAVSSEWISDKCHDIRQSACCNRICGNRPEPLVGPLIVRASENAQATGQENSNTSSNEEASNSNNASLSNPTATPQQSESLLNA